MQDLDETWVNKNLCSDKMWLPVDDSSARNIPSGKGRQLIILHAGSSSDDLIEDCDLQPRLRGKLRRRDYHKEMNTNVLMG